MRWTIGLACVLAVAGCDKPKGNSGGNASPPAPSGAAAPNGPMMAEPATLAKLRLSRDGQIQLDGKPVTVEQLKEALSKYKGKEGVVLFYREKVGASPQADMVAKAIQAVAREGVGIKPVQQDFAAP